MRLKVVIVLVAGIAAFLWVRNAREQRMPHGPVAKVDWMTDAPEALAIARTESRTLLMNFTGSDWCSWCHRLDQEVFSTAEFARYAGENLVLLKLDFPRKKQLSASEVQQNERLSQEYGIRGFPTIVVLGSDGVEKGRLGYQPGGAKAWLAALDRLR